MTTVDPNRHVTITVNADKPGARISPTMWGIFLEDINFAADGGLYAEMVKNRGFQFPDPMMGWHKLLTNLSQGDVFIAASDPWRPSLPRYLRVASTSNAPLGVRNEGFRGMGVRAGQG